MTGTVMACPDMASRGLVCQPRARRSGQSCAPGEWAVRLSPMGTFLTLLTGGGLVAAGAAVGGVLSAWLSNRLGAKRDERSYSHQRGRARGARRQDRPAPGYTGLGENLSASGDRGKSRE